MSVKFNRGEVHALTDTALVYAFELVVTEACKEENSKRGLSMLTSRSLSILRAELESRLQEGGVTNATNQLKKD